MSFEWIVEEVCDVVWVDVCYNFDCCLWVEGMCFDYDFDYLCMCEVRM